MSDEKIVQDLSVDDDSQGAKENSKRSSVYPPRDLKTIIEFIGKVYNQLGHTTYLSNAAIATVHGFAPLSIKPQLSAAQQYKFLELKHGTGYKITEHFQKIFLPKNDAEKRLSIIESLKNPESFRQLFKDYEYHVVPPEGVKNHFIRNFRLKEETAIKAADIFMANLKDFGLLDNRGVLTSAMPIRATVSEVVEEPTPEAHNTSQGQDSNESLLPVRQRSDKWFFQSEVDAMGKKPVPIYLTDNKQAVFVYPDDITEDDIELVKHQIEGILLRIKFEAKARTSQSKESV